MTTRLPWDLAIEEKSHDYKDKVRFGEFGPDLPGYEYPYPVGQQCRELVAWNSALIYAMIYTQPVFYEFFKITLPTLALSRSCAANSRFHCLP